MKIIRNLILLLLCSLSAMGAVSPTGGGGSGGGGSATNVFFDETQFTTNSGKVTLKTNNFGVNGFINYGYTKDAVNTVGVDSYDIATNDTTILYAGPVGGELQLPDPATCNGRWLNIVNTSGFDLSLVCADRAIIAPDYTGSGTLQIVMPTGRSVTLLAIDDETWWETASQFSSSWTNGLVPSNTTDFLGINSTNHGGYSLSLTNTNSTIYLYSLLTDASNYRRFGARKSGTGFVMGSEASGSGVGGGDITIMTGGTNRWTVDKNGLLFSGTGASGMSFFDSGGGGILNFPYNSSANYISRGGVPQLTFAANGTINLASGGIFKMPTGTLAGDDANSVQSAGAIFIRAGSSGANVAGGILNLTGGAAGTGNTNGGEVRINGGVKSGSGLDGPVLINTLRRGVTIIGTNNQFVVDSLNLTNSLSCTTTIGTNPPTATVFNPTGSGTNYISGTNRFSIYWDDLAISGFDVGTGASEPALTDYGTTGLRLRAFAGSGSDDQCYPQWQIPHSAKLPYGSTNYPVVPHMHLSQDSAANTNAAVFELLYSFANVGETNFTAGTTNLVLITNAMSGVAFKSEIVSFGNIVKTNMGISAIMTCRVRRLANSNPSDANTAPIFIHSIDLHVAKDSLGSEGELTKQ